MPYKDKKKELEYWREYSKKYYQQNRKKILEHKRKYRKYKPYNHLNYIRDKESNKRWRKRNPTLWLKYQTKDRTKHLEHYKIRSHTYVKYGRLPKGWEYHHITKPYEVDLWLGVHYSEHKQIDKKYI